MRLTVTIGFILLFSLTASGQRPNLDHLMKRRMMRCEEIHLNCGLLIPEYYQNNKIDSVRLKIADR